MHFVSVKNILSASNNINIYRGCSHGCIYCDSRSKCYNFKHDFEDIEVKQNAIECLEKSLKNKRKKVMITTGSMSDPYLHIESELQLTKKMLEVILKYGHGISLLTKSTLLLRDLELLKQINEKSKCIVQVTLTTFDETLCKIIEPNVATTQDRVKMIKTLTENGIPVVVWVTPFLPYINNNCENLLGLLNYCLESGVKNIVYFGTGLTLREGNREYFYKALDKSFCGLKDLYDKNYSHNYWIEGDNAKELDKIFYNFCDLNNIEYRHTKVFELISSFQSKYEQLSFFD